MVFYGTTEGHSFVDEASLKIADQIKIVAVSHFAKARAKWLNFEDLVLFKLHMYEAQDLASAIHELITNPDEVTMMQENIQIEKHSWSIHKLYPELLDHFK